MVGPLVVEPEPKLRPYQEEAMAFLLSHRRSLLTYAPGTGKTPTVLRALRAVAPARTLIVAPKNVCLHWKNLAAAWWPLADVIDGRGDARRRRRARDAFKVSSVDGPVALVVNYESMRGDVEHLTSLNFSALVFDEGHRLKNRNAVQTRAANALTRRPDQWVWFVTGTPIMNRPEEIWSLCHIIDRHRFSSYWRWARDHYETKVETYGWGGGRRQVEQLGDLHEGALERMRAELGDVMIHRPLEELLPHLPDVTFTTVDVELDAAERRIYDELEKRCWAEIDGEILLVPNEVARMTRLRQVVSNLEILDPSRAEMGSKVAAAVELCADLEPAQVLCLTWSRAAAERVALEAGGVYIHGGVSTDQRQGILEGFAAGRFRILAGTLATLGEGVDGLQVAHHCIRLDRDWTPARNEQALARIRRSGQASDKIWCWDITAADTIDAVVERALRRKENVISAVLAARPSRV